MDPNNCTAFEAMLRQMKTEAMFKLYDSWTYLSELPSVGTGSGRKGSVLDWYMAKIIAEVLALEVVACRRVLSAFLRASCM